MRFEKISYEQWKKDWDSVQTDMYQPEDVCKQVYDNILLPTRSTKGSAGYDFRIPYEFSVHNDALCTGMPYNTKLLTGIRWVDADEDTAMLLLVRSSSGSKYNIRLSNSVGLIDSDYYKAENEGHIMFNIVNDPRYAVITFPVNTKIGQGVIIPYKTINGDIATGKRTGGFGSTGVN